MIIHRYKEISVICEGRVRLKCLKLLLSGINEKWNCFLEKRTTSQRCSSPRKKCCSLQSRIQRPLKERRHVLRNQPQHLFFIRAQFVPNSAESAVPELTDSLDWSLKNSKNSLCSWQRAELSLVSRSRISGAVKQHQILYESLLKQPYVKLLWF